MRNKSSHCQHFSTKHTHTLMCSEGGIFQLVWKIRIKWTQMCVGVLSLCECYSYPFCHVSLSCFVLILCVIVLLCLCMIMRWCLSVLFIWWIKCCQTSLSLTNRFSVWWTAEQNSFTAEWAPTLLSLCQIRFLLNSFIIYRIRILHIRITMSFIDQGCANTNNLLCFFSCYSLKLICLE